MNVEKGNQAQFALVTGAAARVGKAIALHLAEMGFDIGLNCFTSRSEAESTKLEIESLGRKVYLLQADLREPQEIEKMFHQVSEAGVNFTLLVNSASVMPHSDLMEITVQEWDDVINLNLRAVWLMCQQAGRIMQPGGVILNISDAGASQQWTRYGAYAISKNGVNALTRLMAKQLAPSVRVNGIAPGLLLKPSSMTDEEWNKLAERVPTRSAGDMDSFLSTIDLLIDNEYITGETITLNGGDTLGLAEWKNPARSFQLSSPSCSLALLPCSRSCFSAARVWRITWAAPWIGDGASLLASLSTFSFGAETSLGHTLTIRHRQQVF